MPSCSLFRLFALHLAPAASALQLLSLELSPPALHIQCVTAPTLFVVVISLRLTISSKPFNPLSVFLLALQIRLLLTRL